MTKKVKDQILVVRDTGEVNMFDVNGVMWVANKLNLFDLVVFLSERENRAEYSRLILTGEADIEPEEDE